MKTFVDPIPREYLVKNLQLDPNNPRLRLHSGGSSNKEIIERLCKLGAASPGQVLKHILTDRGYLHNEAPVLYKPEKGALIVIDGNRRVAALKMILDPSLIPSTRKGIRQDCEKLKGLVPEKLRCWVTHSKSDAQRIVFRAHNEGTKEWETLSKYFTYFDYFRDGQSISEIAEITGVDSRSIVQNINTWVLAEYLVEHIDGFQIESTGITSFERVTTSFSQFPKLIGIKTDSYGVYEMPESEDLPNLIHEIYLASAKRSGLSRDVGNSNEAKAEFLEDFIPKNFKPTPAKKSKSKESSDTKDQKSQQSNDSKKPETKSKSSSKTSSIRTVLSVKKNVGPKAFAVYKELSDLLQRSVFPIATAALTRVMIESTFKFHAKKLGCYAETSQQQAGNFSDELKNVCSKLRAEIVKRNLLYCSDLVGAISACEKSLPDLHNVMHKDGAFAARRPVEEALNSLSFAVESLIKID